MQLCGNRMLVQLGLFACIAERLLGLSASRRRRKKLGRGIEEEICRTMVCEYQLARQKSQVVCI